MTWVRGSSMGRKQGDHATQRAGTNISGGVQYPMIVSTGGL